MIFTTLVSDQESCQPFVPKKESASNGTNLENVLFNKSELLGFPPKIVTALVPVTYLPIVLPFKNFSYK